MKRPNLWRYWLPLLALSLFVSRCLYEINPIQFASFGDWLTALFVALGTLVVTRVVLNLAQRRFAGFPPDLSPLLLVLVYVAWPQVDLLWAAVVLIGGLALIAARHMQSRARWFDAAIGLIVLTLYLLTLSAHVGEADTFEFQVIMPQWGIAHPTGYPLFVTLGKLFSLLPLGSMAFRLNVLSALIGTLAAWMIYRLIVRLTSDRLAAALAALALAASVVFWSQAIVIEVYGLNALLVTLTVWWLVRLSQEPDVSRQAWLVCALALTMGLALSHHLDSAILFAPLALTLMITRPRLAWKSWLVALGCFLAGLTPWLFIYFRWPALHNGQWMTVAEWLAWITGQRFGGALNLTLWNDPTRWGIMLRLSLAQFGWIGAVLAVLGALIVLYRYRRIALIMLITFAGYFFFGLVYNVPDVSVFVIPVFLIMAIWIGVAISAIVQWISQRLAATQRVTAQSSRGVLITLFALLPLATLAANYPINNQRDDGVAQEAWGRYVLSLPIPQKAALLVDSEKIAPLYYLQVTEHLRPDLDILVLGDEALYRQELDRRVSEGQPVYLARFLPNLPYRLRSLGPLVEVSGSPASGSLVSSEPSSATPAIERPINAMFGDQIKLLGINEEAGNPYRFTLYWQATSPERKNYHVRLQLLDAQGKIWWEDAGTHPVNGYYPTGAWAQNEVVSDFHEVVIEPYLHPGTYDLEVGLFTPFRSDGLTVEGNRAWLKVASVQVIAPRDESLPREVRMVYGPTALLSLDELGRRPPESQVPLRLQVIGATAPASLAVIRERSIIAVYTYTLNSGETRIVFPAPEFYGDYQIRLATGRAARCGWLADVTNSCELGTLTVAGDAIGDAINFENQVLLLAPKIDRDIVQPGEALKVDLTWRGLKAWPDNYTAFVHLLGPDGKVHGQVDQWPVEGTLPTSSWTTGQVVADPYTITLPPDAPSGKYQVEVGWYLLSTLRRLNVLDATGRPSDDHVIIGEFTVP